jgi:diaminohydroxyphosphoribosylaminopyrimidine deaminase / 5-amino-6-(5-phosphoribosylamino)uracil reductase
MTTAAEETSHPCTAEKRLGASDDGWTDIPRLFREGDVALPPPWQDVFGPLRRGHADDLVVVGQLGQSIDARIATVSGDSRYINGTAGLAHLHRLRALVDAVLIGVGTACMDDPQLTVRRVCGPSPARVVVDPSGRLPASAKVLAADGIRRLVMTRAGAHPVLPPGVEVAALPDTDGHIAPAIILAALAERGFRRILVEGGAHTVSQFLSARCLDRLHVMIAPIIIGAGRASVSLPPIEKLNEALRAPIRAHVLGEELLVDCDLSARRLPLPLASTASGRRGRGEEIDVTDL